MHAFISYSTRNRKWAERLNRELLRSGLSTWLDVENLRPGEDWASQISEAARTAQNIIVVIGTYGEPDDRQRREWQAALEAVWSDPDKRLIPILLGDAKLPGFLRSAEAFEVIRVREPRSDPEETVAGLVKVLKREAELSEAAEVLDTTREDRARQVESLAYIKDAAKFFKVG